ncbi:hypothetical protein GQ43DRAFT_405650 [Delitschia confertaspora ATCC 74209]|uniref:WD40 repeat-like protein n=1 Tax=Delitschia confertaspora ATCC 74209 TaxID=1513339 RepID=A0A9P4MMJ6_9PLEO|nr:hypothetical protein GQ43DRAFT_405650 [Delitschia confertaspora ATCC 74209]
MATVPSTKSMILDLPPSCVEFWPLNPQYAVIGTYNLQKEEANAEPGEGPEADELSEVAEEKKSQHRNGSLILVEVNGDEVNIIQTLATPSAILDLHFCPSHSLPSHFGVATSTGSLVLYKLTSSNSSPIISKLSSNSSKPQIAHVKTLQWFPSDLLVTAFSWHPTEPIAAMTLTDGSVMLGHTEHPLHAKQVAQHDLEAWTLAIRPEDSNVSILSGGDDSALISTSLPSPLAFSDNEEDIAALSPLSTWKNKKIHQAGVTAILPLSNLVQDQNLILTGSYDDHIRLLSAPFLGRPTVLAEANLGGGVWRLKLLNPAPATAPVSLDGEGYGVIAVVLASCMHAGARIVKLIREKGEGGDAWGFEVVACFEEHRSMNYGSDVQPVGNGKEVGRSGEESRTFLTTSFYDRLCCLWRF